MIRVENKKTYHSEGIYIGREMPGLPGSVLGNPFKVGRDGTREEVIATYRRWLWEQVKLENEVYCELKRIAALAKHGDVTLICWCKRPDRQIACHGEVVKRAVEYLHSIDG